jgi:hypothetical protein
MSSVHVARQGFITKSALPSVSRARGSTTVADNRTVLLLNGNGTSGAQNNTFLDSSTNNFTITRNGNSTQGSFSPFTLPDGQWSNFFDGTGDFLVTGSGAALGLGTGNWTIEGWVNTSLPSKANSQWVVDLRPNGQGSATKPWLCIVGASNKFAYGVGGNSQILGTTVALPGVWYHFAVVKASGVTKLYVNGTQEGSSYADSNDYGSSNDSVIGTVGDARGTYDGYFNGYISNLRIVKGTAVYTSAFTPPTTNLTAITNTSLLTCQSNRFKDNSSNNFAITRNGDVRVTPWSPFAPTSAYDPATNGGSGYFDGTGDYLTAPANAAFQPGTGDFSVECWFNCNTTSVAGLIGTNYTGAGSNTYIIVTLNRTPAGSAVAGALNCNVNDSATGVGSTSAVFSNNTWNHLVFCRTGTTMSVFLNGVRIDSTTNSTNIVPNIQFEVGNTSALNRPYLGYVSNARAIKGTHPYNAASSTITVPTAPVTNITNTSLLLNFTNAGIFDTAGDNVIETVGNAQISTSVKKYGSGSLSFDGTGDWLLMPNTPNQQLDTGNFTIEGWIYLNAIGTARGFVSKGTSTTGWSLGVNALNQVVFNYASSTINSTGLLAMSTWYFITVVREGTGSNQTKIYINGTNDGTGTVSTNFNQTNIMYVGADRVGGSPMNGYIDDLRITKGFARYTATFTPPVSELIVYGTSENIVNNSTYGVYQLA